MVPLDPIETTEGITQKYLSYLTTTFELKNPKLYNQFKEKLQPGSFVKGPILESTPPFKHGKTPKDLINEGLLSSEFKELKTEELPLDRRFWVHQEKAISKVIKEQKNIVVATGTGSGKTEAFLVPILNHLFRQKEEGSLNPGVRALLLYPMNALANDQLKRMRKLLSDYPAITFGRYTGETEQETDKALEKYKKMNKEDPLPNELVSREQMKETPPHILLTNYAMLEYLLLRPADNVFFDGKDSKFWKYLVVDEAHTYNGAKGIEMAMLLRRLKERIVKSKPGELRCIATSATLGEGKENIEDVANFAQELFGENVDSESVIQATHKPISEREPKNEIKPTTLLYKKWRNTINNLSGGVVNQLVETGLESGLDEQLLKNSQEKANKDYQRFLYHALKNDKRLVNLRKELREGPQKLENIETDLSNEELVSLIDLAVKAKPDEEGQPLLPARYHLFVRAIEGAYLSLLPEKNVYLERRKYITQKRTKYPVFEIAACRQCGATYLVGQTKTQKADSPFEDSVKHALEAEYTVHSQVTCDEYKIDLAVIDPEEGDKYILGVECDGASYHSSQKEVEKDEKKQSYLEDQGWQILRVGSQDWRQNKNREKKKIMERIKQIRDATENLSTFPSVSRRGEKEILEQPGNQFFEDPNKIEHYLLLDGETEIVEDNEDELVRLEDGSSLKGENYKICGRCGALDKANLVTSPCNCDNENYFDLVKVQTKEGKVHKCPACGGTNPVGSKVWRFIRGKDAIASVLATSLYQELPARQEDSRSERKRDEKNDSGKWSSTSNDYRPDYDSKLSPETRGKRQLLAFSDSRQNAAFFAPYLSRTYNQILRRRLILKTIKKNMEKIDENQWRVQDLVLPLKKEMDRFGLFPKQSPQKKENQSWKWILHELLRVDSKIGLEGLGCLGFSLVKPDHWEAPEPLKKKFDLTEDEAWTFFQVLLDSFRKYGAIQFPDNVSPTDDFFKPRNREHFVRRNKSSSKRHIHSWTPSGKGRINTRQDFLMRLADKVGADLSQEEAKQILSKIWNSSLNLNDRSSCWRDYFSPVNLPGEGTVYRMNYNFWKLEPTIQEEVEWYQCDKCKNLTLLNVKNLCPNYRCDGELKPCNPDEVLEDNHYRNLYFNVPPLQMRVKEHTAQLTNEAAADLQTQFKEGDINVLSCSTTFELGVDVGELESVFMRNVPPSTANYVQRAGRAGRRTDATAFALTFCQRRSHDLTHFNNPKRMVSGEIKPPHFEIQNEKIIRRHIFATALSRFWSENKKYAGTFGSTKSFFFRNEKDGKKKNGPYLFEKYLRKRPEELHKSLKRIVPSNLQKNLGIDSWDWTSDLLDEENGVLSTTKNEVRGDVEQLQQAMEKLREAEKPSDYILRAIRTIKGRYLINLLSSENVIPKYGFPVDVVELQTFHHSKEAKGLDLNRDLKIALSEYAPSSQVVARGKLWTSRYLKKMPRKEWPKYRYAICQNCGRYQRVLADSEETLDLCNACGQPLEGSESGNFIKPEFGFLTSYKGPDKPKEEKPEKTYTTRTYYSGQSVGGNGLVLNLNNNVQLEATPASHGKMAVINHAGYQGFWVCHKCGYAVLEHELEDNNGDTSHKTAWGDECNGTLHNHHLGHEFETDILELKFKGFSHVKDGFWLSVLYSFLEGASEALNIERGDLSGCLYPYTGDPTMPALILFDDVPGGAGHVKRIAQNKSNIKEVIETAYRIMKRCNCGGKNRDTSCYGCLRNYSNQFCHDELSRGKVIDFLENYFI